MITVPSSLPLLDPEEPIAIDTEGSGFYPDSGARVSVVSLAWVEPGTSDVVKTAAFPFNQGLTEWKAEYNGQQSLFDEGPVNLDVYHWHELLDWLRGRPLILANAMHDFRVIRAGVGRPDEHGLSWRGPDLMGQRRWDVLLGNKEIWPVFPVALKDTSVRVNLLDPQHWETVPDPVRAAGGYKPGMENEDQRLFKEKLAALAKRKLPKRYDLVDWEDIKAYAALDAELTLRLYLYQRRLLGRWSALENERDYRRHVAQWLAREHSKQVPLYLMEQRGMPFNATKSRVASQVIETEKHRLAAELPFGTLPGRPGNTLNLNHAKKYWFGGDNPRLQPYATTDKGSPQLDAEIARKMDRAGVPHAATYRRWKQLDDAQSKWYDAYPSMTGPDGRLRQSFNQTSVATGRTSVSRVNLQAIPNTRQIGDRLPPGVPAVRDCIEATPGYDLWSIDLAQAELRVAAKWAPCPQMVDMILAGEDLHSVTATALFEVQPDHPDWGLYRNIAKRSNFSLIFDVGPKTFQASLSKVMGIEWPISKIEPLVRQWKEEMYPEFKEAVYRCMEVAERNGYVTLINGRRSYFSAEERKFDLHKAFNRFVQASLAELGTEWMLYVEDKHPGILVNWVHDACYLEVPHGEEWRVEDIAKFGRVKFEDMFSIPGGTDAHLESKGARL